MERDKLEAPTSSPLAVAPPHRHSHSGRDEEALAGPDDLEPIPPRALTRSRSVDSAWFGISRLGLVVAYIAIVVVFWIMRPDVFSQWSTWTGILDACAIPAIIAMALTVTLIAGDFDLSIGAVLGMSMAIAIALMANHHFNWAIAALVALAASAGIGLVNGILVTRARVNSFIGTLAMSSVVGGLDAKVSNQQTISNGVPTSFAKLGTDKFWSLSLSLWIAIALGIVLYFVVAHTETGRYLFAVGGSPEASRLAGVRVRSLRTFGFVVAALGAGLGGIVLASQTASYYPNAGSGYLLPAYAAAFLGTAASAGRFGIIATAAGVLFLQTVQTGLTVLNVQPWLVMVVQGAVLAIAVMVSTVGNGLRLPLRRRRVEQVT